MVKYPRPSYGQDGVRTVEGRFLYAPDKPSIFPLPDYPITPVENFKLSAARKTPVWLPNQAVDFQCCFVPDFLEGFRVTPWGENDDIVYLDEYGCQWKYVVSAGGAMLDPKGKAVVDDITKWEKQVKFPGFVFNDSDFLEKTYDPDRVLHLDIWQGATERLVALLGGYTEAMLALAEEPEACADFINAFTEWEIALADKLFEKYPINLITYHDDWGTERDTFFSERMMEELVLEPTRRIVEHIKNKGAVFELHCCGCVGRFMKYMIDLDIDLLCLQSRANDLPGMKKEVGEKIGFFIVSDMILEPEFTSDDIRTLVRNTVETYGKGGGVYTVTLGPTPEANWEFSSEMYAYSREYYDKDAGR